MHRSSARKPYILCLIIFIATFTITHAAFPSHLSKVGVNFELAAIFSSENLKNIVAALRLLDYRSMVISFIVVTTSFLTIYYFRLRKITQPLSLFLSITLWVLLGLIVYTLLSAVWDTGEWPDRLFAGWHPLETNRLERVKSTLTAIGGIGAIGYLVIKFREQSGTEREQANLEESEIDKKLVSAVEQLGSKSPQVRIAGVHALVDIAEHNRPEHFQRIIDILCGYLRTERMVCEQDDRNRIPQNNDNPTESTIFKALKRLLDSEVEASSGKFVHHQIITCDVDLQDARLLEEVSIDNAVIDRFNFNNGILCNASIFMKTVFNEIYLTGAHFEGDISFAGCEFKGAFEAKGMIVEKSASFRKSIFRYGPSLSGAEFKGRTSFVAAVFEGPIDFRRVKFSETPSFTQATFNSNFKGAIFFPEEIITSTGLPKGAQWKDLPLSKTKDANKIRKPFSRLHEYRQIIILSLLNISEMSVADLKKYSRSTKLITLTTKKSFFKHHLTPLIEQKFIEGETIKVPADPQMHYRITDTGRQYLRNTLEHIEQASENHHHESPTDEQSQPHEVAPADGLAQDEGGEEDGDQHAQLVDGDDHASGAVLERPVVAQPGGTGGGPGGEDEADLPTRNTTDLPELPGDGHHRPGHHQDHPGADRGTEVGLHPSDAGLTEDRGERGEEG